MGNNREYYCVLENGTITRAEHVLCLHLTHDEAVGLANVAWNDRYEVGMFATPAPTVWECMWELVMRDQDFDKNLAKKVLENMAGTERDVPERFKGRAPHRGQ